MLLSTYEPEDQKNKTHPFLLLIKSPAFVQALVASVAAGCFSTALRYLDSRNAYLRDYLPDPVVFNVFIVFASLSSGFRTAHALQRYAEGASMLHKLSACWFDVASTITAFCRTPTAVPKRDLEVFQHTLHRLVSLLSALCLEGWEQRQCSSKAGHRFEVIGWAELDDDFKSSFVNSHCKVEFVFQTIQALTVDAVNTKILTIAAPILTRSFQEMGAGLLIYHEGKKLSQVPMPYAYRSLTRIVLMTQALFTPFVLAMTVKGMFSAFGFTFVGTFLLWFLNGVADLLDNPFRKEACILEMSSVQCELNQQLLQLLTNAHLPTPRVCLQRSPPPEEEDDDVLSDMPNMNRTLSNLSANMPTSSRASMATIQRDLNERFSDERSGADHSEGFQRAPLRQAITDGGAATRWDWLRNRLNAGQDSFADNAVQDLSKDDGSESPSAVATSSLPRDWKPGAIQRSNICEQEDFVLRNPAVRPGWAASCTAKAEGSQTSGSRLPASAVAPGGMDLPSAMVENSGGSVAAVAIE